MKKYSILFVLMCCILISCGEPSNQYLGRWQNVGLKAQYLVITKNSTNGYILKLHENDSDTEFTALMNGDVLQASVPFMGLEPVIISNDGLHFSFGQSCKNCNLYTKTSDN